jgi:carboxypeptidase PM20D1
MKKILLSLLGILAILFGVASVRAMRMTSVAQVPVERVSIDVNADSAAAHLAGAVRFATVSTQDGTTDSAAFRDFHAWMERTYPLTFQHLTRDSVGGLSLLLTWTGADPAKAPVVLMGHQDVVPVIPGTEDKWTHGAFSGDIADGYVWGRGTLDDKVTVIAVLEAVERLLREGYTPARTIYLAFGHDEEVGGRQGAQALVQLYKDRKLPAPALVLDEGGAVFEGAQLGVSGSVAMLGIAEKGFASLELSAEGEGGHSSTPPRETHIGRVARAVIALEDDQFPASLDGPTRTLMETLAPSMPFSRRLALGNLWLFGPVVKRGLLASPQTAAMLRTTTAPTIFQAGAKDNVLPPNAKAVVNFRIRPGETVDGVIARVQRVIGDTAVHVRSVGFRTDPSPVSDAGGPAFAMVATTIRQTLGSTPGTGRGSPTPCSGSTRSRSSPTC